MAGKTAILALRVVTDAKSAVAGLDATGKAAGRWRGGLEKANKAATATGLGLIALAKTSFDAANSQQQAFGAVESVYGEASKQVLDLAKNAKSSVGLASAEYAQMASVLGSQLRNMGVAEEDLIGTSDDLITKGADLAAMFGGTTSDAVEALSSLMRGERDPIEKYGVSIKQADVEARLAAKGQSELEGAARKTAETQATLAILNEQTASATGQFARESDTAAGAQQRAAAAAKDAQAALGQALLPAVQAVSSALTVLATWVQENQRTAQLLVAGVGALVLGVKALNAVVNASPLGRVVQLLTVVAGALVVAYTKSETFREIVNAVWTSIREVAEPVLEWLKETVTAVWGWIKDTTDKIFPPLKQFFTTWWDAVTKIFRVPLEFIKALFTGSWDDVRKATSEAFDAIKKYISMVWNGIKSFFSGLWSDITGAAGRGWNAFKSKVVEVAGSTVEWIRGIPGRILSALGSLTGTLTTKGRDLITGLKKAITDGFKSVTAWFRNLPTRIKAVIGNTGRWLWDKGKQVIRGFIDGVKSMAGAAWDAVKSTVGGAVDGVKNFLRISSPSKLFRDIGIDTMAGYVKGIENQKSRVHRTMLDVQRDVASVPLDAHGTIELTRVGNVNASRQLAEYSVSPTAHQVERPVLQITVNGALDPVAVGRQLETILTRHQLLTGRR